MKTFSQFLDEALASFLVKAAARSIFKNKALTSKIAKSVAKPAAMTAKVGDVSKIIAKPRQITGFRTGGEGRGANFDPMKGSTYRFNPVKQTSISNTAPGHHKSLPGTKPESSHTRFGTPSEIVKSLQTRDFRSLEKTPKVGLNPLELWKKGEFPAGFEYTRGKFSKPNMELKHMGSNIVDIQTATPGSGVGLYGAQRKELKDRLKKGFEDPRAIPTLKRELGIKSKPQLKVTQVPSVASSTYRNVGVGRRESVTEAKTFLEFITEANRRSQRASKAGRKPKEGERSRGDDSPSAVVTVGLPGSGKSTIAKHMVSKGNTDQHELDKSRQALGKGPAYFGSDIVQHTYSGAKKSAEQGRNTVLSNTSIPRQHRQDAIDKLKDSGYENVTAVLSPGSTKAAMRRNRKRTGSKPGEGAVPQFVMNRMAQGMQQMSRDERRELRSNYKKLHKKERFTKPAMKRSGAIQ